MGYNDIFIEGYKIPKKLPKEEMYDLLSKVSQGDTDARKKLIEHNIRLVIFEVNGRFKTLEYDKSELVSIGILGLVKAVDTYDASKKIEFSTYAARCIDNEILMFIRRLKKEKCVDSLDRPISGEEEDKAIKLEDVIKSDEDIQTSYEGKEIYAQIRKIVYSLPEREREIIMLSFGFYDGRVYKQKEIADKLNISRSYASRLIAKIVKKIKKQLEEVGIVEPDLIVRKRRSKIKKPQIKVETKEESKVEIPNIEETKEEPKGEKGMSKKIQSIYEYFYEYTKEQIDEVINSLTEQERLLVYKRYGKDLSNPIKTKLTKEENDKFYGSVIPKIKRKLKAILKQQIVIPSKTTKEEPKDSKSEPKINTKPIVELNDTEKEETTEEPITKEDYLKMLELLRSPKFSKMLNKYSAKEKMIISLKLGYIDGKCFSTEAISKFLEIPEKEIISLTHKVLLEYQKMINSIFQGTIKMVTEKQEEKVFKKTKKEDI